MSRSLRTRLVVALVGVSGPILALLLAALYFAVARSLWADFDRETEEQAQILAQLVEYDDEDGYELEAGDALAHVLASSPTASHVEVVTPRGQLLRSDVLGEHTASLDEQPRTVTLDDGRVVRGLARVAPPFVEPGVEAPPGDVRVVVARDTAALETTLATIAGWFVVLGAAAVVSATAVVAVVISRGVRPVAELGRQIGAIRDLEGQTALSVSELPSELRPIAVEANAMLVRLRETLEHERELVADVAHELRTPLAVLRTSVDVALQRERDADDYRARLQRLRSTVVQLGELVENLLTLARLDAQILEVARESVDLRELVTHSWEAHAAAARSRELQFQNAVEPGAVIEADRGKLRLVLSNLLSNAVAYTATGGNIRVESTDDPRVVLAVRDSGPPIDEADLPRVFDRFWRGDRARSGEGVHCGIGLPLARRLAHAQGLDVRLRNEGEQVVAEIVAEAV